ncbi:MAG: RsmE family RNA methyltransferase [Candidatus Absconditabacteria bacterium]|nr:RsmE family RNA methyltransferase [Candidatus Absconditabacteria bacterium]MDD3868488.1 RsmE family RNA methyltransferase [Candidatus Absconditabacteria bacterium]MDD4713938.1 RsmE family RNA methyltransferase [Candidatus Absconditabacteria bacterium]
MQLFILPHIPTKGNQIILKEVPELLSQLRKVLRTKIGDTIFLQNQEENIIRYQVQIIDRNDKDLIGEIVDQTLLYHANEQQDQTAHPSGISMLIAMPNKRDKAELIVQKLSEIGVKEILFRPAERSIIKQRNEKKAERLLKISQEATEQSRGTHIPQITFCKDAEEKIRDAEVVIFDKIDNAEQLDTINPKNPPYKAKKLGVIGPEGGLTQQDYQLFKQYKIKSLGDSVLRMETAAIIAARLLKNQ